MLPPRVGICLAAACCAWACGDRPELPGPTTPDGDASGSGGAGTAMTVFEAEPRPAPPDPADPAPSSSPDGGPPAGDDDVVQQSPDPIGPRVSVSACTVTETGCVRLYVAVADSEAETCLQLSLDDCNDTTRPGLSVDVPLTWRFASGFVGGLDDECVPNTAFAANDTTLSSGNGRVSWNVDTRQPSELVLDVTLQPSNSVVDNAPIRVSNSDLVDPVAECDG